MQSIQPDPEMIRRTLELTMAPGETAEVRILNTHVYTVSGYFADWDPLVKAVMRWTDKAPAIYFTPNPVNPDLLARADNRLKEKARSTTKDEDIVRRAWLLADFDPDRLADISSSETEHELAIATAWEASKYLLSLGLPQPLVGDSGNGAHVMVRINLPNDAESTQLHQAFLVHLAERFQAGKILVDQATHNAARIWKLYGTWARKGDSIPSRPHRLARILQEPSDEVADTKLLRDLFPLKSPERLISAPPVASNGKAAPKSSVPRGDYATLDIVRWFQSHGAYGKPLSGGKHAVDCPWIQEHSQINDASHSDTAIWEAEAGGWPRFHCRHSHCDGRKIQDVIELWGDADRFCGQEWETEQDAGWDVAALRESKPKKPAKLHDLHQKAEELDEQTHALLVQSRRPNLTDIQPLRIVLTDPPTYYPTVNGYALELTAPDFLDWRRFKHACCNRMQFMPVLPALARSKGEEKLTPQQVWDEFIRLALAHCTLEDAPSDAGAEGAAWESVRFFIHREYRVGRVEPEAVEKGQIALINKAYHFRGRHLRNWLSDNSPTSLKENDLWKVVRKNGGESAVLKTARNTTVRCWRIPEEALVESEAVTRLHVVTSGSDRTIEHENGDGYAVTPLSSHAHACVDAGVTA